MGFLKPVLNSISADAFGFQFTDTSLPRKETLLLITSLTTSIVMAYRVRASLEMLGLGFLRHIPDLIRDTYLNFEFCQQSRV